MRSEIAAADRAFEVRRAARAWRVAGEIDGRAEAAIHAGYPDDRRRASGPFRALFFVFAWFGVWTAHGLGLAFCAALGLGWSRQRALAALTVASGLVLLVAVEALTGHFRLRRHGVEEATAWLAWGYTLGGATWWLAEGTDLGVGALVSAAGWGGAALAALLAWRWGIPGSGLVTAAGLLLALSQAPGNRWLWLLLGAAASWPLAALSVAGRVSPEHRRRFREAFLVAILALYLAVHVAGVEAHLFWWMRIDRLTRGGASPSPVEGWPLALAIAAMIALPTLLLAQGLRRHFRPAVDLGLLLAVVSVGSLAWRYEMRPVWLVLLAGGGLLVGLGLVLRRALSSRAGDEWRGWTARELAEDRDSLEVLEVAATLATLAPAPRPAEPAPGFEPRGGDFGGGGASATF